VYTFSITTEELKQISGVGAVGVNAVAPFTDLITKNTVEDNEIDRRGDMVISALANNRRLRCISSRI